MFLESLNALDERISKKLCERLNYGPHYMADGYFAENKPFVIFLDIDGILNSSADIKKVHSEEAWKLAKDGLNGFKRAWPTGGDFYSIERLELFKELLFDERIFVINVSSWLVSTDNISELEAIFPDIPYVMNGLCTGGGYSRGMGVQALVEALYLDDRYLVIDDLLPEYYKDYVKPENFLYVIHGLTPEYIAKAKSFIESKLL